jgi:hypothetical protein
MHSSNPIEDVYNNIYKFALQYRKRLPTAPYDYLADVLQDACGETGGLVCNGWNPELKFGGPLHMTFTEKIMPLPETVINGRGESHKIDRNHFIMQIFRIPESEEPTINNILRIALYSGLLMAQFKSDDFPAGIVKAYKDLNMHTLVNFVERKDYEHLLEKLQDNFNTNLMEALAEASQAAQRYKTK